MASLKYLISHMHENLCKLKDPSTQIEDGSAKMYKNHAVKFGEWCKSEYRCKTPEDCLPHLQDYVDWLIAHDKRPNTIHTYLAGVCRWFEIPLDSINKPKRVVANNTRRRDEYKHLRKNDFVYDESGYPCVRVKQGKGGKYQEQRIAPEDVDFVRSYFDGSADRVFSTAEMSNKLDLHHLRALRAQRAYHHYLSRLETEPDYRAQLTEEVRRRWVRLCSKRWDPKRVEGNYSIRGNNRQLALAHGLPIKYDRLAVMAVSVFHLSHWRCDVTVANYLLAV